MSNQQNDTYNEQRKEAEEEMSVQNKATPRPWYIKEDSKLIEKHFIFDEDCDELVAQGCGDTFEEMKANAELIVRAVNSHKDLIAACQELLRFFVPSKDQMTADQVLAFNYAKEALAKAGVKA